MRNRARFEGGERNTFACHVCVHNTRIVDQPLGSGLCPLCYELAGWENSVFDNCADAGVARERDRLIAELEKRGGDAAKVRRTFAELFSYVPPEPLQR